MVKQPSRILDTFVFKYASVVRCIFQCQITCSGAFLFTFKCKATPYF